MNNKCLVCQRIQQILHHQNPHYVTELETGYVVLADNQTYLGYTIFLCKQHCVELHELDADFKQKFLAEMSIVASAVYATFKPNKLNYELLGNQNPHMHWHIIPRRKTDFEYNKSIWSVDPNKRLSQTSGKKLDSMIAKLNVQITKLR